ncbi:hypothetical protein ACF0H5_012133 [Mactra antiquata]
MLIAQYSVTQKGSESHEIKRKYKQYTDKQQNESAYRDITVCFVTNVGVFSNRMQIKHKFINRQVDVLLQLKGCITKMDLMVSINEYLCTSSYMFLEPGVSLLKSS